MEVKINPHTAVNNTLATAKRWPRPLNEGGRGIEVSNTTVYRQINRDFGKWTLNGGWLLNRWRLNRGRTVLVLAFFTVDVSLNEAITFMTGKCSKDELATQTVEKT